jgi:hypothetical protein
MTRGKYAARAANARAENVGQRAARLEAALAEERAERAREVADLKARIQQVDGQLTSAVTALAADAVLAAADTARRQVADERARSKDRALIALRVLERHGARLGGEGWADLYAALDVTRADARIGADNPGTRGQRRERAAGFRAVARAHDAGLIKAAVGE